MFDASMAAPEFLSRSSNPRSELALFRTSASATSKDKPQLAKAVPNRRFVYFPKSTSQPFRKCCSFCNRY